jgi:hypothetical protein
MLIQTHPQDFPFVPIRPSIGIIGSSASDLTLPKDPINNIQTLENTVLNVLVDSDELLLL